MQTEKYNEEELTLPTLSNKLHPLLRKLEWQMPASLRPSMEQSLHLASPILHCGALDSFFYTFQSVPHKWQSTTNPEQTGYEFHSEDCDPETHQISCGRSVCSTTKKLTNLTDNVEFQTCDKESGAYTCEHWEHSIPSSIKYRNPYPGAWGEKSTILLSKPQLQTLKHLHEADENTQDLPFLLYSQFDLATTLVYEISHAYRNLLHGLMEERKAARSPSS